MTWSFCIRSQASDFVIHHSQGEIKMAIDIRVRAESRFRKSAAAYNDQVKHGYNPNYVNPQTRRVLLDSKGLPEDTVSWEWHVTQQSTGRAFTKSGKAMGMASATEPSTGFNLPAEGVYNCELVVTKRGGGTERSPVKSINIRDFLIVVIGDSAASGQGNPDEAGRPKEFGDGIDGWNKLNPLEWADSARVAGANWFKKNFTTLSAHEKIKAKLDMDPAPRWLEKKAYRSLRSGAARAAHDTEKLGGFKNPNGRGDVVTFLHFARTGSDILAGLLGPRTKNGERIDGWIGNIGQIEEVKKTVGNRRIDALIISIGVNDVGFTGSLVNLMTGDIGWGKDTSNRKREIRIINEKIAGLKDRYKKLNDAIQGLNVSQVYITEYPTGIFDKMKNGQAVPSKGCGVFWSKFDMSITPADARDLKEAAGRLNQTIREAANSHSWIYVGGIADRFAGHGYCTGKDRFFIQAKESMITQGDTEGTMHPNRQGHAIIADELGNALRKGLGLKTAEKPTQPRPIPRGLHTIQHAGRAEE
jgi:hypothetical protein